MISWFFQQLNTPFRWGAFIVILLCIPVYILLAHRAAKQIKEALDQEKEERTGKKRGRTHRMDD